MKPWMHKPKWGLHEVEVEATKGINEAFSCTALMPMSTKVNAEVSRRSNERPMQPIWVEEKTCIPLNCRRRKRSTQTPNWRHMSEKTSSRSSMARAVWTRAPFASGTLALHRKWRKRLGLAQEIGEPSNPSPSLHRWRAVGDKEGDGSERMSIIFLFIFFRTMQRRYSCATC